MNALTIGSLAAIALMGVLAALWLYRRGKAEGASQQKDKNRENKSAYLALMLLGCGTMMLGGRVPPPILENGWSPETEMHLNGKKTAVKCMTLEDIRKVNIYIELMKANEEVSR